VYSISSQVMANRDGSPRYDVRCNRCLHYDIRNQVELSRAANGARMFCTNHTCPASRVEHPESESLTGLRKAERQEQAQNERAQAARQSEAARRAAKDAAGRKYLDSFREDHRRYTLQQINQGVPAEQIMSLHKFAHLRDDVREKINQAVRRVEDKS
jgi:hypothetical protein